MGKGARTRAATARERIAAQQAAARKAEQRRRMLLISGSIGLVLVIVVALIVGKTLFTATAKQLGTTSGHLPASVATAVTTVPVDTLASIGTGGTALPNPIGTYIKPITDTPLTSGGKPEMLYIGAEYCPYCAAMRWSMAVALSRFGTFGPFTGIHSSSSDIYPNTATLTFYKQRYTSKYLTFTPVENQNVTHKTLQKTTAAQLALWQKYDTTAQGIGYPFISFGNKVVLTGPIYSPQVLHGLTWTQIASELKIPTSAVAINVLGSANYLTAAMCKMTGNTPASVCAAAPIPAIEAKL